MGIRPSYEAPGQFHIAYRTRELGVAGCALPDFSVRGPTDLVPESVGYILFQNQVSSGFELPSLLAAGGSYNGY